MATVEAVRVGSLDAIFTPIRLANAFEQAVERIGRAIQMGLLRPGDRLPSERDLAIHLSLSRSTVREALRLLSEAGYLEARRGRGGGTFVVAVLPRFEARDPRDAVRELGPRMADSLRYRQLLEAGCAEMAAEQAGPEAITELAELATEVTAAGTSDYQAFRAADARFHIAIARLSGTVQAVSAVTEVHAMITEVMSGIPRSEENLTNSLAQHARLMQAIAAHDAATARAVMREHVEGLERLLSGLLPTR